MYKDHDGREVKSKKKKDMNCFPLTHVTKHNCTAADNKFCDFFNDVWEKIRLDILCELSAGRQFTLNAKLYFVTKNSNKI